MGRLDSWLNRQVGWRRVALTWVMVCPLAVALGSGPWGLTTAGVPHSGAGVLEDTVLSALAAIPLAVLAVAAQPWWREKRNLGRPYLSWLKCVAMWCTGAGVLLGTLTLNQQPSWHRSHRVFGVMELALAVGTIVFWLLAMRRSSKVNKNGWPGGAPVSASPRRPDGW